MATNLTEWAVPCLIVMGAGDADFLDQARRAAAQIPRGQLLLLEQAAHDAAHVSADDVLIRPCDEPSEPDLTDRRGRPRTAALQKSPRSQACGKDRTDSLASTPPYRLRTPGVCCRSAALML